MVVLESNGSGSGFEFGCGSETVKAVKVEVEVEVEVKEAGGRTAKATVSAHDKSQYMFRAVCSSMLSVSCSRRDCERDQRRVQIWEMLGRRESFKWMSGGGGGW